METQRHLIRRQIIELHTTDVALAQRLSAALPEFFRRYLLPVLDRCLSEAARPGVVLRIDRLELDLGRIPLATLEQELPLRLAARLEAALRQSPEPSAVARPAPPVPVTPTERALEFIAAIATTGTLPWWGMDSDDRPLDAAVSTALRHSPGALADLMRDLVRRADALDRLIRGLDDARLSSMFTLLTRTSAADSRLPGLMDGVLNGPLAEAVAFAGIGRSRLRHLVWRAALRTAGTGQNSDGASTPTGGFLAALAAETGADPETLLDDLRQAWRTAGLEAAPAGMGAADRGDRSADWSNGAGTTGPPPADPATVADTDPRPLSHAFGPTRPMNGPEAPPAGTEADRNDPAATARPPSADPVGITDADPRPTPGQFGLVWPTPGPEVPPAGTEPTDRKGEAGTAHEPPPADPTTVTDANPRPLPDRRPTRPTNDATDDSTVATAGTGTADRSCRTDDAARPVADRITTAEIRPAADEAAVDSDDGPPLTASPAVRLEHLRHRSGKAAALLALLAAQAEALPRALWPACRAALSAWPEPAPSAGDEAPGLPVLHALARPFVEAGLVTPSEVRRVLAVLEPRDAADSLERRRGFPAGTVRPGDARERGDACFVDDAGLCLLWPFLSRFFSRLGLTGTEPAFVDEPARHRAVLLLHHAASGATEAPDYRLALDKVLCGIDLDTVHEPDIPVTGSEAAATEEMLHAVLAHTSGFATLSVAGLRDSFLQRRGALSTRDGCWLLRVERRTHDILLDCLPWPMQWTRLPWMPLPLRIEW